MNKFLKWFAIVLGSLTIITSGLYLFVIRPIIKEEAGLKPVLTRSAVDFIKCLEAGQIDSCYHEYTTEAFQAATDFRQMTFIANSVTHKLGGRISGVLNDKSFNLNVNAGPDGTTKTVRFVVSAVYRNDAMVTEKFVYAFDKRSGKYKIQSFNINSNRLLQ